MKISNYTFSVISIIDVIYIKLVICLVEIRISFKDI